MTTCEVPDCQGTYGAHGYCLVCGTKAPKAAPAPKTTSPEPLDATTTDRQSTRTSKRLPPTGRARGTARGQLGGGWIEMPEVPAHDPTVLAGPDPEIPESKRFCRKCGNPVGRGRDGKPGRIRGFCGKCKTSFFFGPTLSKGDSIDRYEIVKCIARGGQGWVYLALDTHLREGQSARQVILKGVIDTTDEDAVKQAKQELKFLIDVKHPNIVDVTDFVEHPDEATETLAGYIVMEYINGRSLQQLYREYRDEFGNRAPLPLEQVLVYGMEVLQAMAYLHDNGMLYCDFKPDNAMHAGGQVKLIDLGAVVRINDEEAEAYMYTPGFGAPEVTSQGPSIASDLYTVGRSLAVLSLGFEDFTTAYEHRLPSRDDYPLLVEQESFYRLLRRATHPDPRRRFASADDMRAQVEGVLLEMLSTEDHQPRHTVSTWFTVEQRTFGTDAGLVSSEDVSESGVDWSAVGPALPTPLVDPRDPSASYLAAIAAVDPVDVVDTLLAIPEQSPEVILQLVGVRIATGELEAAQQSLDSYAVEYPTDWRVDWYRGVAALSAGLPGEARKHFEAVYDALPGELPPKIALAAAAEWDGDDRRAGLLYERVWRTDNRYVSAAFGFARVLRRQGEVPAAVAALDGVPEEHNLHEPAQVAAIRACLALKRAKDELLNASARLEKLKMGIEREARLSIEVLQAALDWVGEHGDGPETGAVLGHPLVDRQLRFGLEKAYRNLATVTEDIDRRIELVKAANRIRPRTLF